METSAPFALKHRLSRRNGGFSLVEVTLAIGIVAFAFLAIFGLIPTGLNVARQAIDITLASQIAQRVVATYQQKDFDLAIVEPGKSTVYDSTKAGAANMTWCDDPDYKQNDFNAGRPKTRISPTKWSELLWYSQSGNQLDKTNPANKALAIYCVNVRVTPATALPKVGGGALGDNENLATITVQVALNPSQRDLAVYSEKANDQDAPMRLLWTGAFSSDPKQTGVVSIYTFNARIERNR